MLSVKKAALWRRLRNSRTSDNKAAYYNQVATCKSLLFEYEKSKEMKVIKKSQVGAFYRYVNRRMTSKSGVGPLRHPNGGGTVVTDDSDKANMLNDYFCSVSIVDDGISPEFDRRVSSNVYLDAIDITRESILKFIQKSKAGTSPGPDGIPSSFLKQFKLSLLDPLLILFRYLAELGHMPNDWKLANITPVLKKGLASDIINYRPISLTSVFCKLFERMLQDKMLHYLFTNKLLSRQQHGFLAKHSTCTQLLEVVNDWSIALRNAHSVDVVYFDISKAFDTVSHHKLKQKLLAYGFEGKVLSLISDFITGRSQRVVLPNGFSQWSNLSSGVPQGSVLGPLLFLLYINDIVDLFTGEVSVKLFADDIKIYMEIKDSSETAIFQKAIDNVDEWARKWQLKLSIGKCQHMLITLRRHVYPTNYLLNAKALPTVTSCIDLGVCMDSALCFSPQVNCIVSKAKLRASQILRCFHSRDPGVLTKAFVVYVRPIVEYCSPVWSPCTVLNINNIESVQRTFTKRLSGMRSLSYNGRLSVLGLERLELRRIRADLTMCFKIVHRLVDIPFDMFFKFAGSTSTRGHPLKLLYPDARINARAHAFPVRIVSLWNRLPANIVLPANLKQFKMAIKNIDFSYALIGKD